MRNFYQVGHVYIWQNLVDDCQYNGKECIVIDNVQEFVSAHDGKTYIAQKTDEVIDGNIIMARKGFLRPKFPPSGEKSISEMFSKPYVKELAKEKELEENCV